MLASLLLAYTIYDFLPDFEFSKPAPVPVAAAEDGVGELSVIVQNSQKDGILVARGATRVPLLTLELSASCDAPVTLETIDLQHIGLGSVSDIRVYAVSNFRRVSRVRRFQQDGTTSLRISRFGIDPCDVEMIDIVADVTTDADAAGEHGVSLSGADAITSTAAVTRFQSEETTRTSLISSPFTPGDVTLRFLATKVPMLYGSVQTLARLQLSADADGAHVIRSITLTNEGSARGYNFIDLRIEDRQGNVLTRLAQHLDGREVTLHFDPTYILNRSETKVLLLKGEVRTSYARSVDFVLKEESDLVTTPYRRRLE